MKAALERLIELGYVKRREEKEEAPVGGEAERGARGVGTLSHRLGAAGGGGGEQLSVSGSFLEYVP